MHHNDQREALYGIVSEQEIRQVCGVNRTTAMRWKAGHTRMPAAAARLIQYTIEGELPPTGGDAWRGWRLRRDGRLYAPDLKRGFTPEHVRMLDRLLPMFSWHKELRRLVASGANGHRIVADELLHLGKAADDVGREQRSGEHR